MNSHAPLIIYGKVLDEPIVAVKLLTQDRQEIQDTIASSMFGIVAWPAEPTYQLVQSK